jgi:transcriptional regulator with XRE-family HTH domain
MPRLPYDKHLLSKWIKETGLSDRAFAERVGCKRLTILRARKGQNASMELLGKCAAACGKNLAELLPHEDAKKFGILVSKP